MGIRYDTTRYAKIPLQKGLISMYRQNLLSWISKHLDKLSESHTPREIESMTTPELETIANKIEAVIEEQKGTIAQ
ncbi:hypothetical protein D3C78_18010 [compost metagenome]